MDDVVIFETTTKPPCCERKEEKLPFGVKRTTVCCDEDAEFCDYGIYQEEEEGGREYGMDSIVKTVQRVVAAIMEFSSWLFG